MSGTITIWYAYDSGSGEETAFNLIINNAKTAFPTATILTVQVPFNDIYTLYETQVLTGGGPDMYIAPNDVLGNQVRAGVIRNVNAYLQGRLTQVNPTALEGMKVNGQLYGVPESAKAVALYYNKLNIPTPPSTTADLLTLVQNGKKLVLHNGDGGGAYFLYGFYGAFGGQLLDATGRCIADQGGVTPAVQYLLDLKNAGATIASDYGTADTLFKTGTVDMLINGPWTLVEYEAIFGNRLGVTLIPTGTAGPAQPLTGIDGFYLNPNTQNFTSTIELALYLTNQQSSQIFTNVGGHIPVRSDVTSSNPLINTFALAAAQGLPRPQVQELDNYWGPFGSMFNNVFSGTVSPTTGVRLACKEMNTANGFPTYETFLPLVRR